MLFDFLSFVLKFYLKSASVPGNKLKVHLAKDIVEYNIKVFQFIKIVFVFQSHQIKKRFIAGIFIIFPDMSLFYVLTFKNQCRID